MAKKRADTSRTAAALTDVRVIAGRWRGRKIRFAADGIRPTGDRVRETLFNWIAPALPGATCLDMFAGSGALGIESLSRGAAHVIFVEKNRMAAATIERNLQEFGAAGFEVLQADALQTQLAGHSPLDIVFLDPPFRSSGGPDLGNLCTLLEQSGALASHSLIYLEMEHDQGVPELPAGWQTIREKTSGQVRYALAERRTT